jgi:histidinol-phosphate aminotransferase
VALDANEWPWRQTLSQSDVPLNRYPHPQPEALRQALAEYYGVTDQQLLISRGSGEGIDLLIKLLGTPFQDAVMTCPPTFSYYQKAAQLQGLNVYETPLSGPGFELDKARMERIMTPDVKLIFLCSPNNPTGNIFDPGEIEQLCSKVSQQALVIVDEAYIEFADEPSMTGYLNQCPNLVVLRSLSKSFGLAGARIGAVLAQSWLIERLSSVMAPYPLAAPSIEAANKVLAAPYIEAVHEGRALIKHERARLVKQLADLEITRKVWPSQANFILAAFDRPVMEACQAAGINIRNMAGRTEYPNCVRLTVGSPEDNDQLIATLGAIKL